VVAACDVNDDHTEVALTTDDYLWVKLCQLKEDELAGHDSSHERITYSQFQTLVLEEYGNILMWLFWSLGNIVNLHRKYPKDSHFGDCLLCR